MPVPAQSPKSQVKKVNNETIYNKPQHSSCGCILIIVGLLLVIFAKCGGDKPKDITSTKSETTTTLTEKNESSSETNSSSRVLSLGDTVMVNQECMAACSESAFDEMNHAAVAYDDEGLMDMIRLGYLRVVKKGTKGKLLENGFLKRKVRFEDDHHA